MNVNISKDNVKMGAIPSVSMTPIVTCKHCESCAKKCYAKRMMRFKSVKSAWENNHKMFLENPNEYFQQISDFCRMQRFFRWHVSGDIINYNYLLGMVKVANDNPRCSFLAFTKHYEVVNEYLEKQELPSNLQIIFSDFLEFHCENPNNLPTTDIIKTAEELPKNGKLCGGNCTECCCRGVGCWELKKGEKLYFIEH